MRLVVGGSCQGKLRYTMERYGISPEQVSEDFNCGENTRILQNFQQLVQKSLRAGEDPRERLELLLRSHPDLIVLCDEVGCGVVPVEPEQRLWRETVGRLCCALAERAESVERVCCGLARRLK